MSGKIMETLELPSQAALQEREAAQASTIQLRAVTLRHVLMIMVVLLSVLAGGWTMYDILAANGLTVLEGVLLGLFIILFSWLVFAFWTSVIGFVLQLLRLDPLSLRRRPQVAAAQAIEINGQHAIVMPVYNEDTQRIMAGFEACVRELAQSGQLAHYDFYMLSDTRDPQLAVAELAAWQLLCRRLATVTDRIYYRRREQNTGRKVGNIADFCQRWGYRYSTMLVLDADSLMSAESVLQLTHTMQQNPRCGLIQTVPMPVRQRTFFGRFVQFAAHLYSPMLATGLSFWQTDRANYWGHNAIVRIDAFMQSCGLPTLEGRGPFGGEILSHDFVEAALLRRAGWQVFLLTDIQGSYEEVPSNILEYATRDRRWAQGNIQHLSLLNTQGLRLTNKLHFIFGAFAYVSSLLLMVLLGLSTVDAVINATHQPVFFVEPYQLFPVWPIAKSELMQSMLLCTVALLFMPKVLGLTLALLQRRQQFGGAWALLKGFVCEVLFAIMIAPVMMMYHGYFVLSILAGRSVRWEAQAREGRMVAWSDAWRRTSVLSSIAVAWGITVWYFAPQLFVWLLPLLVGLFSAALLIRYSSSLMLGEYCRKLAVMLIPEEHQEVSVLKKLRISQANLKFSLDGPLAAPALPAEHWQLMPLQQLTARDEEPLVSQLVP